MKGFKLFAYLSTLYTDVIKDIDEIVDICKRVETLQESLESIKYLMDDIRLA